MSTKYISQEKARFIFEELTGLLFPLTRKELNGRLELDGYCKELKLAFEYNGEQHYDPLHYYNLLQAKNGYDSQIIRDKKKRKICKNKGITLIEIRHTNNTSNMEQNIRSILSSLKIDIMTKKVSWSNFTERVSDLNKSIKILHNKNITLLTESYLGSHSIHGFQCSTCLYSWKAILKDVLYRSGCPKCAGNSKHLIKDIQQMSRKSHIDLLSNVYTSMLKKHRFRCRICQYLWEAKPNQIQQGQGCPKCSGNIKISSKQFCHCIKSKNIELLDKYQGLGQKYRFLCQKCDNIWTTLAMNIWNKTGCPKCANANKRINIDHLKLLASKRHLKLLSPECMGIDIPHIWECISCRKQYSIKPSNVQRGTSCRSCKKRTICFHEEAN